MAVNRVYVIELSPDAGRRRDPRLPWVYVGSSARSPEERFAQHLRGYKASRMPRRFGLRLRPDLYEDIAPIRGKRMAVRVEEERARELAACGFVAHCDGTSFGTDGGDWREWDGNRVEPVADHVHAAVDELAECSFTPLDAQRCAELLYGTRAFWVAEYLDQADPPPSYGLFPHVRLDALTERAAARLAVAAQLRENADAAGVPARNDSSMELPEIETKLRADLESIEAEIAALIKPPDDNGSISYGKRIGDGTTEAVEQFNEVGIANDLEVIRENTVRALAKIDDGTYGTCDSCGAEIPEGRLHAAPSSVLCIDCARKQP